MLFFTIIITSAENAEGTENITTTAGSFYLCFKCFEATYECDLELIKNSKLID